LERVGSIIGRTLKLPFEYAGTALEGTLVPIEEERGGFAAGLSATTATPTEKRGHLSFTGGSLGTRSGFVGGGIKYQAFPDPEGPQLGITASASNRGYLDHTAYIGWNDPARHPYARVTGYYDLDSMDEFWGLGPDTDTDDKVGFSWEKYGGTATAGFPEGSIIWGRAYVNYERTSVFRSREVSEPDLVDVFPEFDFPELELWGSGANLTLDLRDSPGYPKKGIFVQGTAEFWRSAGDEDLEWIRYTGEASGHIPLGGWHVFSVKAGVDVAEPEKGEIPFPYLPTLGGSQNLRGFASWRWRDEAALYGTAEFRWRIWLEHVQDSSKASALETAIFYDVGDVGDELGDIDLGKDRKTAYGLLARFYLVGNHLITLGAGRSDEETRFVFTTNNSW
jgi:outer membrane protein assembly factor BamA